MCLAIVEGIVHISGRRAAWPCSFSAARTYLYANTPIRNISAKAYGAKNIIAAGGPKSLDLMKQWGATTVVDYHKESVFDAAGGNDTVDVVFDNHGAPGTADKAMPVIRAGGVFIFLPGLGGSI